MAKFTVFFNGECINTYEMEEPVISIGRLPENAISIANMGVSRRHTKIEEDADRRYIISDLNSLNGTYVNGKRIKKANLNNGDKIAIGKYTILYEDLDHNEQSEHVEDFANNYVVNKEEMIASPTAVSQQIFEELESEPQNEHESQTQEPENSEIIEEEIGLDDSELKEIGNPKLLPNEAVLIETNKHVVYKLDKAYLTMGNGDNDDIFVSGFMISEGQVSIEKHEEGYVICVNKFIGKFKINNKSIKTHVLQHKDRIEIGSSTFRYMENG
jgi:pSer/pThr/pTyr-binding forkhead associated (FHA) protein